MVHTTLTRAELYELVWCKPLSALMEELQLPRAEIKKLCINEDIPLPPLGYWFNLRNGKPVDIVSLPVKNNASTIDMEALRIKKSNRASVIAGEKETSYKVPIRLQNADPLVRAAEFTLRHEKRHLTDYGLLSTDSGQLPIRVSRANITRALLIMDTLIKCWHNRGYKIAVGYDDAYVQIRETGSRFSLREVTKKIPKKGDYDMQKYEASGQLVFKVDRGGDREWKDGPKPLEDQLLSITNYIEQEAQKLEKFWAENALKTAERQRLQREAEQKAQLIANERLKFEQLVENATRWQQAKMIRNYLAELSLKHGDSIGFVAWLAWAIEKTNSFDPLFNEGMDWQIQ